LQFSSASNVWSGKKNYSNAIMHKVHLFNSADTREMWLQSKQINKSTEPPSMCSSYGIHMPSTIPVYKRPEIVVVFSFVRSFQTTNLFIVIMTFSIRWEECKQNCSDHPDQHFHPFIIFIYWTRMSMSTSSMGVGSTPAKPHYDASFKGWR
jgi:hypothetical protein